MTVEIFTDCEFSGTTSGLLNQDYAYIGDFWNDKISSIKVYSGTWEFFADANYQGQSFQLQPGSYPTLTNGWNDVVSSIRQVTQAASPAPTPSVDGMAQEILDAHNSYRSQVGVPPLVWSEALANHAQEWANYLSANNLFQHSGAQGEGENLWMGTSHRFSFTQMVEGWGNEKQHFVEGTFPNVSNTGNWVDVGHYTQMVWRNTTQVGCACVDGDDGNARLVCRYSPQGNFIGQSVF